MSRRLPALAAAAVLPLAVALGGPSLPSAQAATACAALPSGAPIKVAQMPGWTESIIVDNSGRMFATDIYTGQVFRIDHPGASPVALTGNVGASGGIVVRPDGKLLVGTQNNGPLVTNATVLLVDPDTGAVSTYAAGLDGIDGLAIAPDGSLYTTTFASTTVGRVSPTGQVTAHWASVLSPNGIAVSPDGRHVYVIQSWIAPTLYKIAVDDPAHPQSWVPTGLTDAAAMPDGLTLDSQGRPLIATHVSGQILRAENGQFCAVQSQEFLSPQITYGHGPTGFSAGRLYRSGVDGGIYEIPAGFDAGGM